MIEWLTMVAVGVQQTQGSSKHDSSHQSPCFNTFLLGEAVATRGRWWLCFPAMETDMYNMLQALMSLFKSKS